MWAIWANQFLTKALKSCQKSNKSPYLVTLDATYLLLDWCTLEQKSLELSCVGKDG